MGGVIGSAKIITFRTTRHDSAYGMPILGIASGVSTGHIALLLTFTDQELFNKYIANNKKIPHSIKINPETQQEYYEVYVSFWPKNQAGIFSDHSELRTYEYDVETSAFNSPFVYNEEIFANAIQEPNTVQELSTEQLADMIKPLTLEANELRRVRDLLQQSQKKAPLSLNPIEKKVKAPIPLLQTEPSGKITLGPVMVVHTSSLKNKFGEQIMPYVEEYAKHYTEWREMEVLAHNYKIDFGSKHQFTQMYASIARAYKIRAQIVEINLKHQMFPDQYLSHEEFIQKLEPYVTIGAPERDSVGIPIVRDLTADSMGLELEPMLQYIVEIANNPDVHQYHVLKLNCAAVTYNTLWAGAKRTTDAQLKQYLALAWYVNVLGLTLTPSMIIQNAATAEQTIAQGIRKAEQEILRFSAAVQDSSQEQVKSYGAMLADLVNSAERYLRS